MYQVGLMRTQPSQLKLKFEKKKVKRIEAELKALKKEAHLGRIPTDKEIAREIGKEKLTDLQEEPLLNWLCIIV